MPQPLADGYRPAPLQRFAGELAEMTMGNKLDLWALQLMLQDADGGRHIVYIAHGRGAQAGARCQAQFDTLRIGTHYYGSATLHRQGDVHHYWMGAVSLQPCQRRPRFALVAAEMAARAAAGVPA